MSHKLIPNDILNRLRGIMDDSTVRQMFRRYLCSPTKAPDVIKGHCAFDYREWCLTPTDREKILPHRPEWDNCPTF